MSQPIIGQQYTFKIGLDDLSNPGHFKAAPTIGTSDFRVSINGGVMTTINTKPSVVPSGSVLVAVTLSASEMWAPDPVIFGTSSASEWSDVIAEVKTVTDTLNMMHLASGLFNVDMSSFSTAAARSPTNALRSLRNRVTSSGGLLTVYRENDTTAVWTAVLTVNVSAVPIVEVEPG